MSSKKSKKKHSTKNLADITINDFANSTVCKNRPKKSNNVAVVLKTFEEEKNWDEKVEEFDGDFVEELAEDGTVSYVIRKTEGRRRKKTLSSSEDKTEAGNNYPIDIWFLLSEFIQPEDVGRFAAICKTSYGVVCTAKFWYSLYRRYFTKGSIVPKELQPDYMVRKYGLRASVIRALHFVYPVFSARRIFHIEHPDVLKRMQCVLIWFRKSRQKCVYYFKMQEKTILSLQHSREKPNLLEILDDVYANQDEHCRILRATCLSYTAIPPVLGLSLTSVSLTLSQGLRHHRLQLGFGSVIDCYSSSADGGGSSHIVLEPVVDVKVLDWWHPLYPHSHNMEHLLNQD